MHRMRESCRSYSQQICGVRSLEALSQIRISKSPKVCVNKLSSSSGKNSCPLNTGIPIESLGIELEHHALIRAEYVGRNGPDQQRLWRYHFVTRELLRLLDGSKHLSCLANQCRMRLVLCVPALSMMRCTSRVARDLRLDGVLILLRSTLSALSPATMRF